MVDNPKDDNAFEDADFEDLDPIEDDDLGDEGWDDDLSGNDVAETADSDPETGLPKEKTFVQKNFMLIVGGIVVIFGGVIGVSMFGGGSSSPMPDPEEQAAAPGDALPEAPLQAEYEVGADMPPMPAPINPGEEGGALTPMPTPAELENAELAELHVDEVPAEPPSGTTPQGEEPFDYRSNEERTASDEPEPKNAAEKLSAEFASRSQTASAAAPVEDTTIIDSEGNMLAMPAPVLTDNPPESAKPAPPTAEAPSPQPEVQKAEIDSLQSKLGAEAARAAEAEKSAQELQANLDSKTAEIESLTQKVAELEKKLAEAESAPAAEEPASAPKKASKPKAEAPKTAAPAKAPAPKQQATAPKEPAKILSWELKAAQPGKAVLFSKATGDTRNVAVGDTVEGLGKIASISNETGRWTVRGSRGQVSR